MSLQTVSDLSDTDVLEANLGLYLKPVSRIKINVQIPKLNAPGQSISTYHVMEKLKETVRPDTFIYLKSLKITATVIKFEGELETKAACERALARLRAVGTLKINGSADNKKIGDKLQVRAAHAAAAGPTRHDWEAFFRDAKGVNEMRPGERPDTVHLQDLPVKWFHESHKSHSANGPNDKLVKLAFGGFGKIRRLEIPSKTQTDGLNVIGKTGSHHKDNFDVYIQYEEYIEFAIAMDALRGKKLLYKDPGGKVYAADIKVDFDRTKYLSELSIRRREAEERKLKPDFKKESETTKNTSNAAVQAKESEGVSLKPPVTKAKEIDVTSSKPEVKCAELTPEEKRMAHFEAKVLLRELLKRSEKTEKLKEEIKKGDKDLEPLKRPMGSSVVQNKRIKPTLEKEHKSLASSKEKHNEEKPHHVKVEKELKRTHSEENKSSKEKNSDKRIKTEVHDKNNHHKLKKHKEESSKTIENRSKEEPKGIAHIVSIKKEKDSEHSQMKSAFPKDKNKDKSSSSECGKANNDYREKQKNDKCEKTNETSNISKQNKSSNSNSRLENKSSNSNSRPENKSSNSNSNKEKDKNVYLEVNCDNRLEDDEELRMREEERKLKDRLLQSYYQKQKNEEKLLEQERILKQKLVKKLQAREKEKLKEREKLRKELSGRKVLKSVLADTSLPSKKH